MSRLACPVVVMEGVGGGGREEEEEKGVVQVMLEWLVRACKRKKKKKANAHLVRPRVIISHPRPRHTGSHDTQALTPSPPYDATACGWLPVSSSWRPWRSSCP